MPLSAFALVMLAGFIHACWNIAAKKAGGDARFAAFAGLVQLVFWGPLALWVGWQQLPGWRLEQWLFVGIAGVLHLVYFLTLLRGYRRADLTVVYPLARGTGPLLSSLAALWILGETLSFLGALGIACVIGGVFFVAGGPALLRRAHDPAQRARVHTGLYYGALTGLCIASYTVVDGYAVKVLLMSPILVDYLSSLVRTTLLLPAIMRNRPQARHLWRSQWKYAAIVGIVSPVSYVMVLYALQVAPLSHVAPAREISMLFAALLGGHLLSEGERGPRIVGAALMAMGVISLGLG